VLEGPSIPDSLLAEVVGWLKNLSCGFARLVYILRVSRLELDQTMLFGAVLAGVPGSEALLLDAGRLRSEGGGPNRDLANPGIEEVYVAEFMVEAGDMAEVEVEEPCPAEVFVWLCWVAAACLASWLFMGKSPADNRLTLVTVVRKLASISSLALAIWFWRYMMSMICLKHFLHISLEGTRAFL